MKSIVLFATIALSFTGGAVLAQTATTPPPAADAQNGTAAPASPATGGGRFAGLQQVCAADFQTLCPGMTPGDGKLGPCIRANRAKLSKGCSDALGALRASRSQR